jgi:hypothetical protein
VSTPAHRARPATAAHPRHAAMAVTATLALMWVAIVMAAYLLAGAV